MTSPAPIPRKTMDDLEARAADQRRRLQEDVAELRHTMRERLDAKRYIREHAGRATLAMALLGLALGYLTAGAFTPGEIREK